MPQAKVRRRPLPTPEGLRVLEPKPPAMWERLRGKPVRENALIAIETHLANAPDLSIERDRVHQLLAEHGADFADPLPALEQIYARAFGHAIARRSRLTS